jgi:hypothetical protein
MKLATMKLGKRWWIVGDEVDGPWGPYTTRSEAEEDRRGVLRSLKLKHWTTEEERSAKCDTT